jgi:hypothetical protein
MAVNDLITFRKGTASQWISANPVLASGEPGYDLTNGVLKIGDGFSNWVALSGIGSTSVGGSSSSPVGVRGIISTTGNLTSFAVSGGYPVGYLDLFQDGVKLVSSLDFSATDGSNVTLSNSVPSGTVLEYLTMTSGVSSGGGSSGLSWSSVPASATATGTAGSIAYDSDFFYIATASNTWKRTTLSTWSSDPYYSSVSLLLHFNGDLTDSSSSPKTITAYGDAVATGSAKFGSGSLALDGTGDYVSTPYSSAFDLSTGDWTVECWAYASTLATSNDAGRQIFAVNGDSSQLAQSRVVVLANGSIYNLSAVSTSDWANTSLAPAGTINTGAWYHIAAVRYGSQFILYVNGVNVLSYSYSGSIYNFSSPTLIGFCSGASATSYWAGMIDEFRVTKGIARYTANFTPTSIPFPNS